MRIRRVDFILLKMPRVGTFETSYGRQHDVERLLLKIHGGDFVVYTECVAETDLGYSYETIGTAREILKVYLLPTLAGKELEDPHAFWEFCGRFRGHPMAKAAVENALWILKAMEQDKPLARILGNYADRVLSGVSIGIQKDPQQLVEMANRFVEQGYPRLKLKIKPGADIAFVEAVRNAFPEVPLTLDANNAYTLRDIETLTALDRFDLLMIEQPLAYDDIHDHAKLQAQITTPICLDESIHGPEQARVAIETKACGVINIKQGRVGGLTKAIEIHDLCQEAGIGVWCGGMGETGVGRAIQAALAGLPNFVYPNDISASDRYFSKDIIEPQFVLNPDGTINVPQERGLGVIVDERTLDRYTIAREVMRI